MHSVRRLLHGREEASWGIEHRKQVLKVFHIEVLTFAKLAKSICLRFHLFGGRKKAYMSINLKICDFSPRLPFVSKYPHFSFIILLLMPPQIRLGLRGLFAKKLLSLQVLLHPPIERASICQLNNSPVWKKRNSFSSTHTP